MNTAMDQVVSGAWDQLQHDAMLVREQVFIQEQQIAAEDEWDEQDAVSLHFVIYREGQAIATARLLNDHSVGRVAVLKAYRGQGLGQLIMQQIIALAQQQQRPQLHLSAQTHALDFYQQLGFLQQGEVYLECNIPHIHMQLLFAENPSR